MRFIVINGPNLNLLGKREPEIYGSDTLHDLEGAWRRHGAAMGIGIDAFQSNHEGVLIDHIQDAGDRYDAIIINPGAYSHYSYAIHDALTAVEATVVEVHISNIREREPWRATSVVSPAATHTIYGRGVRGYIDAIDHLWAAQRWPAQTMRYGDEPDQFLELRRVQDARGTVALLHGGFWREHWHRDLMDRLAVALLDGGWSTANIEYRRGPASFEAATTDVDTAMATVANHSDAPVIAVGHSAGGYLALRSTRAQAVHGAVGLAPVVDLPGISEHLPEDDPPAAFLGATIDADRAVWERAALGDDDARNAVIIHGTLDEPVPHAHSAAFAEATGAGFESLAGVDHMALIDPTAPPFTVLLDALATVSGRN